VPNALSGHLWWWDGRHAILCPMRKLFKYWSGDFAIGTLARIADGAELPQPNELQDGGIFNFQHRRDLLGCVERHRPGQTFSDGRVFLVGRLVPGAAFLLLLDQFCVRFQFPVLSARRCITPKRCPSAWSGQSQRRYLRPRSSPPWRFLQASGLSLSRPFRYH
jgi:hypothetical protein